MQEKVNILINMVEKERRFILDACGTTEGEPLCYFGPNELDIQFVMSHGFSFLFSEDPKAIGELLAGYISILFEKSDSVADKSTVGLLIHPLIASGNL